ncbi:MAG: rod shape-determining protein MreC [Victivallaceae bacterium]|nr:rod shape-determining protein MreC [Victivallaceae bacterium]
MSFPNRGKIWLNSYLITGTAAAILLIVGSIPAATSFARRVASDFFHPYVAVGRAAKDAAADKSLLLLDHETLAAALAETRRELGEVAAKAERAAALAAENNALRQLVKLRPLPGFRYLTAEVLLFDPLYWKQHFTLNAGSADGVVNGAAVLFMMRRDGEIVPAVAGFVGAVTGTTCEVSSLYDQTLRIPVRLVQSGAVGFLNGENMPLPSEGLASISYLPLGGGYRIGESAVTAGFDPGVPAGLRLGELALIDQQNGIFDGALYRRGYLRPALGGIEDLNFVVIIVPEPAPGRAGE